MDEEWIVRVEGQEYGPVDLETLREWQREGRLLLDNPVRKNGDHSWINARQIPGIFPTADLSRPPPVRRNLAQIIVETFKVYGRGFWQFMCLSALVFVPSFCGQLSSAAVGFSPTAAIDWRAILAALFNLTMLLLTIAAWPVYVAGVQILTSELAAGRSIGVVELVQRALQFWLRVLLLCILVYGAFFFLTVFALGIATMIGGSSLLMIFFALGLLVLQIWMFGRLFVNVLFWQQFAVLENAGVFESLRQSRELARSGRERLWYQRPLWRGAVLASLWCVVVMVLNLVPEWQVVQSYFRQLTTSADPQAMIQALSDAKPQGANLLNLAFGLVQTVLHPLLGISFVLVYFETLKPLLPRGRQLYNH